MLHYLNGMENENSLSGRRSSGKRAAKRAVTTAQRAEKRAKETALRAAKTIKNKKPLLKRAFNLLPPVAAINLIKRKIEENKKKPFAASQIAQYKSLKNELANRRKNLFKKKGDPILIDEETINEAPVLQDEIENDQIAMEVEDEIQTEQELEEESAEMGIYYPMPSLSGKKERAARKQEKSASKVEKRNAKAQLKRDKGEAKKTRAARPRKSGKEIFDTVLDSAKSGLKVYQDFKGGAPADGMMTEESGEKMAAPSFFEKNKMLLIGGGLAAAVGLYFVTKKK
jgi:hypothetical protein